MDVHLRQIRAFLTIARVKSFTGAAAVMNVTQPALTMQIRRLEEALGVALFDRDTRSVALTRVARELLPAFARALQDFDATFENARDLATGAKGVVRLAALPSVAASLLPDAILRFRERRPQVLFDLRDVIAGRVLGLVQTEAVDFGVMGGEVKAADVDTLFQAQDRLHAVFPRGHPIERFERVTPEPLSEFPLILMDRETSVRAVVDAGFARAGLAPEAACEAIYMMTAAAMARAGLGVTILPGSAREIKAEPDLVARPIDDPAFGRPVSIIKKAGRTLPPMSASFVDHLCECLDKALGAPSVDEPRKA